MYYINKTIAYVSIFSNTCSEIIHMLMIWSYMHELVRMRSFSHCLTPWTPQSFNITHALLFHAVSLVWVIILTFIIRLYRVRSTQLWDGWYFIQMKGKYVNLSSNLGKCVLFIGDSTSKLDYSGEMWTTGKSVIIFWSVELVFALSAFLCLMYSESILVNLIIFM